MEIVLISLLIICIILLVYIIKRQNDNNNTSFLDEFKAILLVTQEKIISNIKDEFSRNREENRNTERANREEITNSIISLNEQIIKTMTQLAHLQKGQLEIFASQLNKLVIQNEERFNKLEEKINSHLTSIKESNEKKLEEMRLVVDEKLQQTLEKRLGESFQLVSDRLEIVHKGLGEMQTLATGVGDLKRVLTNIKTRGTWGEVQLGTLIDQVLAPDQYSKNVEIVSNSGQRVEFAIKLPGRSENKNDVVWLPIDAKFPFEDYQRLIDAQDIGNLILVEEYSKEIEKRIKENAKSISSKYISPPYSTDFAIMFLPIEGLYAEVLRRPGLTDSIQKEYRVMITGPTNLSALLNSLQMGFRTLAIEKRSSEVWKLLGLVKSEFGKFGDLLEKTQSKLDQASKQIGEATTKTRSIERKLRDVQELPETETDILLE